VAQGLPLGEMLSHLFRGDFAYGVAVSSLRRNSPKS
jgi:hypothetical protein